MNTIGAIAPPPPHAAPTAPPPVRKDQDGDEARESQAAKATEAAQPNKVDIRA